MKQSEGVDSNVLESSSVGVGVRDMSSSQRLLEDGANLKLVVGPLKSFVSNEVQLDQVRGPSVFFYDLLKAQPTHKSIYLVGHRNKENKIRSNVVCSPLRTLDKKGERLDFLRDFCPSSSSIPVNPTPVFVENPICQYFN